MALFENIHFLCHFCQSIRIYSSAIKNYFGSDSCIFCNYFNKIIFILQCLITRFIKNFHQVALFFKKFLGYFFVINYSVWGTKIPPSPAQYGSLSLSLLYLKVLILLIHFRTSAHRKLS